MNDTEPKPRRRRKLWWILAAALVLVVVAVAALPLLVDANRYRGLIESRAREALGREVRLGELRLSLWPVFGLRVDDLAVAALPGEREGDLLTARSVRVGARPLALLRKRLEITSLVVQSPQLQLERGPDGSWNVERLLGERAEGDDQASTVPFRIGKLRVTDGTVRVTDAGAGRTKPLETGLGDLQLELEDLATNRPIGIEASATLLDSPETRLRFRGTVGPLERDEATPLAVRGELQLRELVASRLLELAAGQIELPAELVGERPFSLRTRVEAELGAATRIALGDLTVEKLELTLKRSQDGRWNLPAGGPPAAAADPAPFELEVSGLRLADAVVRVDDRAGGLRLALEQIALSLDRLPTDAPATIDLTAKLESEGQRGNLSARGTVGPTDAEGNVATELALRIDPLPPTLLRQALGQTLDLELGPSAAKLSLDLGGTPPGRFEARGSLELAQAKLQLTAPDGTPRSTTRDFAARYDVVATQAGEKLELRSVTFDVGGQRLDVRGTVELGETTSRVDLELLPTRLPADELAAMLALLSAELPFSFASKTPVELEGRVRGEFGGERLPGLEGRARLRDFSLGHASLSRPLERVSADITIRGEQVAIREFSGVVGSSDVAGEITLEGFAQPRVRFDLRSSKADFGELFSFLQSEETGTQASAPSAAAAPDIQLDGRVRIASGSFETLDFTDLDARMRHAAGVLTLDPVKLQLYGGSFAGRVTADLNASPPPFEIGGEAVDVDTDAFLADNLESPGLLTGRFSGRVETRGSGTDYESVVRALSGSGSMEVQEGRVGRLDVLKTVSRVSGVFGETTLRQISRQVAREGTEFNRLVSGLRLEGGTMAFDDLLVESPVFSLEGRGTIDLLATTLDGQFRLAFSTEVSQTMRTEKSRAAEVFWNAKTGRVELPFSMKGPFDAPTPGVDFRAVARDALRDRVGEELRGLLDRSKERDKPAAVTPTPTAAPGEPSPERQQPAEVAESGAALRAEIVSVRWGGSVLARDLRLEGRLQGVGIARAALSVTDAKGIEIERVKQLREVEEHLASSADPAAEATLAWTRTIDGKKLLLAKFPVTVRLTVTDVEGRSVETVREVDR